MSGPPPLFCNFMKLALVERGTCIDSWYDPWGSSYLMKKSWCSVKLLGIMSEQRWSLPNSMITKKVSNLKVLQCSSSHILFLILFIICYQYISQKRGHNSKGKSLRYRIIFFKGHGNIFVSFSVWGEGTQQWFHMQGILYLWASRAHKEQKWAHKRYSYSARLLSWAGEMGILRHPSGTKSEGYLYK